MAISVKISVGVHGWPRYHGVGTLPKISTGYVGCTDIIDDRQPADRRTDRQQKVRLQHSNYSLFMMDKILLKSAHNGT